MLSHIAIPGVSEYEFGVYNIVCATSDDATGYVKFSNLFRLHPDVMVDRLVEKLHVIDAFDTLALSSRVQTSKGERHIPMIDFARNVDTDSMLDRIGVPRHVLVYSGNSFHHYDTSRLLTQNEFEAYMKLLSEQPEVGSVWPGFQLEQGFALLRITPSASKPFYPEVVE